MIIDGYAIQLSSGRQAQSRVEERVSVSRQSLSDINQNPPQSEGTAPISSANSAADTSVALSRDSLNLQRRISDLQSSIEYGNRGLADAVESLFSSVSEEADDQSLDADTYQLKSLVESLIGREIDLRNITQSGSSEEQEPINLSADNQLQRGTVTVFEAIQLRSESEVSSFSAQGQLQTADGQIIEIDLSQTLQREFVSEVRLEVISENTELKDPLVINKEIKIANTLNSFLVFRGISDFNVGIEIHDYSSIPNIDLRSQHAVRPGQLQKTLPEIVSVLHQLEILKAF